jgi:general secretion pathway protein B
LSSILRALKKLEADKARSRGGQIDLTRDILRPAEIRRHSPFRTPLLIATLILAGGLFGMALMFWVEVPVSLGPGSEGPQPSTPAVIAPPVELPASPPADPPQSVSQPLPPATVTIPPADESPTASATPARPQLVITGIVYQDDPESRIAVVNDLPAMLGARIEGALVEEIRSGSVVFNYQGQRFEVFFKE